MKLFISYSRDDKNFIFELAKKLNEEVQYDVWIDRNLKGAELWWETILNSIEACNCFVIILTPKSVESIYCGAELNYALALGKPILPLMLKRSTLPKGIEAIHYIDIEDLSLTEVLLKCSVALRSVEMELLKTAGGSVPDVPRPPMPQPQVNMPEQAIEVYGRAEDAVEEGKLDLARDLYRKVMEVDPRGLGEAAFVRLNEVQQQAERQQMYAGIADMVTRGRIPGARAAWRSYVQKYGQEYDPERYAVALSDVALPAVTAPTVTLPNAAPPPPATSAPSERLSTARVAPAADTSLPRAGEMLCCPIPASAFLMGAGERRDLPDFAMDQTPVTNDDYRRFVEATRTRPPWKGSFPMSKATHPVTGVTFQEAEAYAKWVGKRLPTAAEWEKAARGTDGRQYPWGNEFDPRLCNTAESRKQGTTPVQAYPQGASVYGVLDMAGNVWEWTLDEVEARGFGKTKKRVLKGGSWKMTAGSAKAAEFSSASPDEMRDDIGFRCVSSV